MSLTEKELVWMANNQIWFPQPGPQTKAIDSKADMLLYGGAAGGGKTAGGVGLAVTEHRDTLFIRREATQLGGVIDYIAEVVGTTEGLNRSDKVWQLPAWDGIDRKIVLGSTPNHGDERKYMGRPKDLLVIDEAANMLESQVQFLRGWVRSTIPGQRCRTLLCSNPPTDSNGFWLTEWFAPWLDPTHNLYPHPPGELLWYATIDGKEQIVDSQEPFTVDGERVIPQSRTYIPARITDNAYLKDTGYVATLQALPEPLRSQMLYGDFTVGQTDSEWQVIPSAWVKAAQDRWVDKPIDPKRITSAGIDPSRGGRDETVLAVREGWHFHPLGKWPGAEMDTGAKVASKVIDLVGTSACPVHIDVIGIGASVIDHLNMIIGSRAIPVNAASKSDELDWAGVLTFANKRAELWWRFRDMLNPANGKRVALPPDRKLAAELCSPTYKLRPSGILIESKDDIVKRLGRSTDSADAVIMAGESTPIVRITSTAQTKVRITSSLG